MLTCPCKVSIDTVLLEGVVVYLHHNTQEHCPWFSSIGTSLESIFLEEYPTAAVREKMAMFLACQAVRMKVYRTMAGADSVKLPKMLSSLHAMIAKSLMRDRVLAECVTVFGVPFQLNWCAVNKEQILAVQALPEPLERLEMRRLSGTPELDDLDVELTRYMQRKR
jgi:hypothetical protein